MFLLCIKWSNYLGTILVPWYDSYFTCRENIIIMIRPTLPRVLNLLRGRWYEIDFLRSGMICLQGHILLSFNLLSITYIHTYKGPIKISQKQFFLLICIFLSVRNLNSSSMQLYKLKSMELFPRKKVSFLQSVNSEINNKRFNQSINQVTVWHYFLFYS